MSKIQKADSTQAALIADLSRETFYDTFASENTEADMKLFLDEQFGKEMLMEELKGEGNHFFLAYESNTVAGYVFLKERSPAALASINAVEISRIYVRSSFIGKGIGKQLMETAISFAISKKLACIWLGVWENNLRAIRFYESFGFVKFGEQDFLLGRDIQRDWLMRLVISG